MRVLLSLFLTVFVCFQSLAKDEIKYPVHEIPAELMTNADAVVRYSSIQKLIHVINQETVDYKQAQQTTKHKLAITILNNSAEEYGNFRCYYDDLSKVSEYSLKAYDKTGKLIYKPKKSDFKDQKAYTGSFFDDLRMIKLDYTSNHYPYTVEIEYTEESMQTFNIGSWNPIPAYNVSVEHSEYTIQTEDDFSYRFKERNIDTTFEEKKIGNGLLRKWELNNLSCNCSVGSNN